jgi:hypothetical protein
VSEQEFDMSSQNPVGQAVAHSVALEWGVTGRTDELSSAGICLEGLPAPTAKPSGSFSRSEPSRQSKLPSFTGKDRGLGHGLSDGLTVALRSRRVRAGLTCVGVLLVGGLFALNFREPNRSAVGNNEFTEMELTEFGQGNLTSNHAADTAGESSIPSRSDSQNMPAVQTASGFDRSDLDRDWPPQDLRQAGLTFASNGGPANRFQAVSATRPRGAWLTGQIELDSNPITSAAAEWSNSGFTSGGVTSASIVDRFQGTAP